MIYIDIPKSATEIKGQIKALEYIMKFDTRDKDKKIHAAAIKQLNEALKKARN